MSRAVEPSRTRCDDANEEETAVIRWVKPGRVGAAVLVLVLAGGIAYRTAWPGAPGHSEADQEWAAAQQSLNIFEFTEASRHLKNCVGAWPLNAETHFQLARTSRRAGNAGAWESHLRAAGILQWPQEDLLLETMLMRAQSEKGAEIAPRLMALVESGRADESLVLEALIKGDLAGKRHEDLFARAYLWSQHVPGDPRPWFYRGEAHNQLHSVKEAIADYGRALELQPLFADARARLAQTLAHEGRHTEAAEQYRVLLQSQPSRLDGWYGLASCQMALGELEPARIALDELLARQSDHAAGLLLRTKLAKAEGAPEQAIDWLKRADQASPKSPDVADCYFEVYRQLGKTDEARRSEQQAQDLRRDAARLEEIKKKLGAEPKNVALLYDAGMLCVQLARDDEAFRWLDEAVHLKADHREAHRALAELFEKHGNTERATYHREKSGASEFK